MRSLARLRGMVSLGFLAVLVACAPKDGGEAKSEQAPKPKLPKLELVERLPWLEEVAARADADKLDDKRRAEVVELLELAFLPDGDRRLAARAKRSLLGEADARLALEAGLVHAQLAVRQSCAWELGLLGEKAAIPQLIHRLKYEKDEGCKLWVAIALARLDVFCALERLSTAMAGGALAQSAGLQAIEICKRLGRTLPENPSYAVLITEIDKLADEWRQTGRCEKRPPKAGSDGEKGGTENEAVKNGGADAQRGDTSPKEPAADAALLDARLCRWMTKLQGFQLRPVDDARFVVSRCGRLGLERLRKTLHAKERYLRSHSLEVVRALGRAANTLSGEVLALLAEPLVRNDAARTLGELGASEATPFLIAMLDGEDLEARTAAAYALGPLGAEESKPKLLALRDDDKTPIDVRVAAAFSLALFELERPSFEWLRNQLDTKSYHEPTLRELLDRVRTESRRRNR